MVAQRTRLALSTTRAIDATARHLVANSRWRRHGDWIERRRAGETLTEIARDSGVTREAVRQWINRYAPEVTQGKASAERRTRVNLQALTARLHQAVPCIICGCWVLRRKRQTGATGPALTCSSGCTEIYRVVRLHINPDAYVRWRGYAHLDGPVGNRRYNYSPRIRATLDAIGRPDLITHPRTLRRPVDLTCGRCGKAFAHNKGGQRPKFCPTCAPRRSARDSEVAS